MIYTGQINHDGTQQVVLCQECRKAVGWFAIQEISELSQWKINVYCFECDNVGLDSVPNQLLPKSKEFVFIKSLDRGVVWVGEWKTNSAHPTYMPYVIDTSCLSSTSYLLGPRQKNRENTDFSRRETENAKQ